MNLGPNGKEFLSTLEIQRKTRDKKPEVGNRKDKVDQLQPLRWRGLHTKAEQLQVCCQNLYTENSTAKNFEEKYTKHTPTYGKEKVT